MGDAGIRGVDMHAGSRPLAGPRDRGGLSGRSRDVVPSQVGADGVGGMNQDRTADTRNKLSPTAALLRGAIYKEIRQEGTID